MTKTKSTKHALIMSVMALFLCFTMLLGTTFAWFTDSVTSAGNKIMSGTLKVDLELLDKDSGTWNSIKEDKTALFNNDKWEPGYTEVKMLKVENEGTLALKWKAKFVAEKELSILADVIDIYVLPYGVLDDASVVAYPADRNLDGYTKVGTLREFVNTIETTTYGNLEAGESAYLGLALKMQESANNDYQGLDLGGLIDIHILATQLDSEEDGFGPDYDKEAEYPEVVDVWDGTSDTSWYNTTDKTFTLTTAEQLAGLSVLAANGNTFSGKTIVLNSSMDFDGQQWTPIKQFSGTFDGGEHTVSNFTLDGTSGRAGFIQNLGQYPATVKNLTLSEVNGIAGSNQYFGIVAANGHTSILENVHIVDCKIETTNKDAWVGGIYGYFNWTSASNCTVENLEIDATDGAKFLGGFSGNMDQDLSIDNVDIIGLKITVDATNGACQVGGFTGQTQTGHRQPTFNNCDVTGLDIVAKGEVQLGGFVGDAGAHTIANNCTVEGKIDASGVTDNRSFIGGFIADSGWNNNESNKGGHKLTNCSADVDIITGGSTAGGFIGSTTAYHSDGGNRNMPITMTNCTAIGTVTVADGASATIGGFAGEAERGTFKNCSTTSDTFIGKVWDGYTITDDGNGVLKVTN